MYKISDIQVGDYWYNPNYILYAINDDGVIQEIPQETKIIVVDKKLSNNIKGNYILSLKLEFGVNEEYDVGILDEGCRTLRIVEKPNNFSTLSFTQNKICKNNKLRFYYLSKRLAAYVADFTFYKKK